jgi:hypothetical protein
MPERRLKVLKPLLSEMAKEEGIPYLLILNNNIEAVVRGLSRYFGNSAQFWLNLQNYYDLESEMEEKKYIFKEIVPYSQVAEKTPAYV